jgi:glucokinase
MVAEDPSAVIAELALASTDAVCVESLELFASIYGAEAGDIALRYLALGGVFIGGGIAPKVLPALQTDAFMRAFVDKGRYSDLVASMPVFVSLEPRTALLGAAHYALSI